MDPEDCVIKGFHCSLPMTISDLTKMEDIFLKQVKNTVGKVPHCRVVGGSKLEAYSEDKPNVPPMIKLLKGRKYCEKGKIC